MNAGLPATFHTLALAVTVPNKCQGLMWHAMGRKICQPYTYFTSDRESAPYFILTSAGRAQKYATRRATARRAAQHFAGPHPGRTRQISRFLKCSRSGRTGPVPFWIFCCTSPRTPTVHPLRRRSPQGSPCPHAHPATPADTCTCPCVARADRALCGGWCWPWPCTGAGPWLHWCVLEPCACTCHACT